jgi:hypothetical protein
MNLSSLTELRKEVIYTTRTLQGVTFPHTPLWGKLLELQEEKPKTPTTGHKGLKP